MRINLNNTGEFTIESLKKLIASGDDSVKTQFRVTNDGFLFISKVVGDMEVDDIKFFYDTNGIGNGFVGKKASEDEDWLNLIFNSVNENWPNPSSKHIGNF
jgi:hypothetical protein